MINSRFTVAAHLLTMLALARRFYPGLPVTSEDAAESVSTNPVVIRRILGCLRKAGLVSSQSGPHGGWFLERNPEEISLRDVYRAVEDEHLFAMHHRHPNPNCPVGGGIQSSLLGFFQEAETAMEEKLGERTVADIFELVAPRAERAIAEGKRPPFVRRHLEQRAG